ncbi:mannitol-1-phosphate 5-dehydrogenase [Mollicutes bacterium LVI A0039]|nr:mannitol-1-phosphate 5-dehydrogenase [Mollicutes bacterium LVI A0039]
MKVVHFGAGNIGRGFMGDLLYRSGYEVTFVDVNDELIKALNTSKDYNVIYLDEGNTTFNVKIAGAINSKTNSEELREKLAQADLITTSLGQINLKYITDAVCDGLRMRISRGNTNCIDIIACENGLRVSTYFKTLILEHADAKMSEYLEKYVGFVDSAVDRIVPDQVLPNICDVEVEPFYEWVLEKGQVRRNDSIAGVNYVEDLSYFNKRKLLTVNLTHSLVGYVGTYKKFTYVEEALRNPQVNEIVCATLDNITEALVLEFGVDPKVQSIYANKVLDRFKNEKIIDELSRVSRNPLSKLSNVERYISPLKVLIANKRDIDALTTAIAYALTYANVDDEQAVDMQDILSSNPVDKAITIITGIDDVQTLDILVGKYQKLVADNK